MIPIILFFIIISGLIFVVFRLFQGYIKIYNDLKSFESSQMIKIKEDFSSDLKEMEKELNTLINGKELEMERRFTSSDFQEKQLDLLTNKLQLLLKSSFNLIKIK